MEKKSQKLYLTDKNLLTAQDIQQVHYQVLSIILLKKFLKFNVNTNTMIKNVELLELNKKIVTTFFEY